jgi:hypothetical protein
MNEKDGILMKKRMASIALTALLCTVFSGAVFAFTDLEPAEKEPIMALKNKGVVSGMDSEHFVPRAKISFAQSVSLIVKGLNLNIDNMKFIKKPEASDYFTNVPNDAWYAEAFIIANLNGLNIPKDVDPNAIVTHEQFADLLIRALDKKGTYPVIKMLIIFADENQIDDAYKDSMQRLYLHKLAKLDNNMAYPKLEMTRGEAAIWVYNTMQFIDSHTKKPSQQADVTLTVEPIDADTNKVTLSRGEMPNPGYGIQITGIRYPGDGTAVIQYTLSEPKPGMMYPQVITEAKAETNVSSQFKPVIENQSVSFPSAPSSSADPVIIPTIQ